MRSILRLSIGLSLTLTASCLIADGTDPDALERRAPPVKVKVCHLPPGNPGNARTIEVSEAALPAHLGHGDHVGQCECPPGEEWVCYSGPAETDMVGACVRGVKTCAADGMSYGPCVGEVTPVAEVCGDGEDNDCDGAVDDGCAACTAEVCGDGLDNDCDGVVDDGCVVCTPEVCGDGLDNDCDGTVDDGCVCAPGAVAACYDGPTGTEGVGACAAGTQACDADGLGYGACVGAVGPAAETCGDGLDNDCDGAVDDGCVCAPGAVAACYDGPAGTAGVGTCAAGAQTCDADGLGYGACVGAIGPAAETCGDGLDNDCDGAVDDGCVVCAAEVCGDGLDNDCDGQADEGCIGDRAWRDSDRDGVQDVGEPGVAGATFLLRTFTGALVGVAVSDAMGSYWFSSIPPGSYYIEVVAPFGLTPTLLDAGPDDVDSDVDFESMSTAPFGFSGAALPTIDVGFIPTADS